ncbi:MAG: EAL domain-containing protein [Pseudomonadales bacterium]|nr:EAL domain-containing protein [Pseudomonadales bacterium]
MESNLCAAVVLRIIPTPHPKPVEAAYLADHVRGMINVLARETDQVRELDFLELEVVLTPLESDEHLDLFISSLAYEVQQSHVFLDVSYAFTLQLVTTGLVEGPIPPLPAIKRIRLLLQAISKQQDEILLTAPRDSITPIHPRFIESGQNTGRVELLFQPRYSLAFESFAGAIVNVRSHSTVNALKYLCTRLNQWPLSIDYALEVPANVGLAQEALELITLYALSSDRLIFVYDAECLADEDAVEAILEMKDHGLSIGLKNLVSAGLPFSHLESVSPEYLFVSSNEFTSLEDPDHQYTLQAIERTARNYGSKTVATEVTLSSEQAIFQALGFREAGTVYAWASCSLGNLKMNFAP